MTAQEATAQEERALAMANELRNLLGDLFDLPRHGPGSCVERAWDLLDPVVEYLEYVQFGLREPPRIAAFLMSD